MKLLAIVMLTGFILLSFAVHQRVFVDFDFAALLTLQNTLPRWVDAPFSVLSLIGLAEVTGVIFLLMVWRAPRQYRLSLFIAFGVMTLVELIGKTFIYQPAVPDEFRRYIFDFFVPSGKMPLRFSYPSGHAARTTFLVILLASWLTTSSWTRAGKSLAWAMLFALEALMLVSRVYLGEHWTTDVIGGTLLASASVILALNLPGRLPANLLRRFF